MRTRSILMLASVAMILMVAGVGNAFAANLYSGTDTSAMHYSGYRYLTWDSSATGSPTVSSGTSVQWANSLTNSDSTRSYQPYIKYTYSVNSQTYTDTYPYWLGYGSSWTVSSNPPALEGQTVDRSGSYSSITHWYKYDPGGAASGVSNPNNVHSWTVS